MTTSSTHPTAIESYLRRLPKAELHLHIEGTLEPELAFELAGKHGVTLPFASAEELRQAYQFTDLKSFLDIYYAVADVLRDAEDFQALTAAYLRRAHEQGVVHVEVFVDPQTHTSRGISFATVLEGMLAAFREAGEQHGMTHRIIPCFLRHLTAGEAQQTLDEILAHRGAVTAVGLDSSERGHPPEKFTEVFARARQAGLLTVAHAGEEGPAAYVRDALDILAVARIDHGVRCEEDPQLVDRLAREQVPLTVCPLSNLKLRVVDDLRMHNLRRLLERGVCVTVNSDDPAYFGGYVLENYLAVQAGLDLTLSQMTQLARNSIQASFLDSADKARWLRAIDSHAGAIPAA